MYSAKNIGNCENIWKDFPKNSVVSHLIFLVGKCGKFCVKTRFSEKKKPANPWLNSDKELIYLSTVS